VLSRPPWKSETSIVSARAADAVRNKIATNRNCRALTGLLCSAGLLILTVAQSGLAQSSGIDRRKSIQVAAHDQVAARTVIEKDARA
jgi:hypothetical protein